MFEQTVDPVLGSLTLSALVGLLPLLTIFVLLGVLRVKAHYAGLAALVVALVVAVVAFRMPIGQALSAAGEGAAFGLFPIMWIVVTAIWVYTMTLAGGHFDVLRRSFATVSDDQRVQAIIVAFCFGALMEALAGFGTPVAISSVMLIGLGFTPMRAAAVALVANTAPVAFGALAVPITTLAQTADVPVDELSAMVGRQTPVLAVFVPLVLVLMVDGRRGVRQCWLPAVVCGVVFALAQFVWSNLLAVELTDIVAALLAAGAVVALLRVWRPAEELTVVRVSEEETRSRVATATASAHEIETGARADVGASASSRHDEVKDTPRAVILAYSPYLIIVLVFTVAQLPGIEDVLASVGGSFRWPGLHIVGASGKEPSSVTFAFKWLSAAGTLLLFSGVLTALALRIPVSRAVRAFVTTLDQLKWAILTVVAVLALAYVMNLSGQTNSIGTWIAGTGAAFAFLSPVLGWLGVAVTGSDTSSNALFGALQVSAAKQVGISEVLTTAANTSGGVLGKMISPQNLAIAAASTSMPGQEGELFRRILGWSLVFLLLMCVLVLLQSTPVLGWMVP